MTRVFFFAMTVQTKPFCQGYLWHLSFCQGFASKDDCTKQNPFVKDIYGTYPFDKGLRCSLFDCTRIPFDKDCTCKCLLSRLVAAGLFFLSKNGSETFCQGFLSREDRVFLSKMRNLLSRFLVKRGQGLFVKEQKPFVKVSRKWASSFCQRTETFCQGFL